MAGYSFTVLVLFCVFCLESEALNPKNAKPPYMIYDDGPGCGKLSIESASECGKAAGALGFNDIPWINSYKDAPPGCLVIIGGYRSPTLFNINPIGKTGSRHFRSICHKDQSTCYEGNNKGGTTSETNSPGECKKKCSNSGYSYAGVAFKECLCGNEEPPVSRKKDSSECDFDCPRDDRDDTKKCGGHHRVNVFKAEPSTCYEAEGYGGTTSETNTPEECKEKCSNDGYNYAGVVFNECMCGHEEPPVSRIKDSSECNFDCPGDYMQKCGGFHRVTIQKTGVPSPKKHTKRAISSPSTKSVRFLSETVSHGEGCGRCACKWNWGKNHIIWNSCVPPSQPSTSWWGTCSCSCKADLGSCKCSMKGRDVVTIDNKCKNGGEPKANFKHKPLFDETRSLPCECIPSPATCINNDPTNTLSAWQNNLVNEKKMRDVILTGTHHSGLVNDQTFHAGGYFGPYSRPNVAWATAQDIGVKNQLKIGVRLFDLRLNTYDGKYLFVAHGEYPMLTRGVQFKSVVEETVEFLKDNPTEFVVWNLKWEAGAEAWDLAKNLLTDHESYFYKAAKGNPLDANIEDVRNHIIVCSGTDLQDFRSSMKCKESWHKTDTDDGDKLKKNLEDYIENHNVNPMELNILSAVCTPGDTIITKGIFGFGILFNSLERLSKHCNNILKHFFNLQKLNGGLKMKNKINAIMMDYINPTLSETIIKFNQDQDLWKP